MRILGLDIGTKTIGVAISDPLGFTAQGLTTWRRRGLAADLQAMHEFINDYGVEEVLIGLPLNMNGSRGPAVALAEQFATELSQALAGRFEAQPVKITLRDERLSTRAAERTLLEGDVSRRNRKRVIDKMAAVFILQGYLDYLRNHPEGCKQ
ncbi:MAG: Holliday junction resolvase RuvX [Clostridiales bacterium]|nr:Holliday junction resolvase RuvX [Clostridiales bacterium]